MEKPLQLLGTIQRDKMTGFTGACASVSFDTYGCVMAFLVPSVGKDGNASDGHWFDIKRLEAKGKRVMPVPKFLIGSEPGPQMKSAPSTNLRAP